MSIQVYGKEFSNLHFVARAIDPKHKSDNIKHIYADQDNIVGTDGFRLHLIANEGLLDPGFHQIIKKTKTELQLLKINDNLQYPDYKRLFKDEYQTIDFKKTSDHLRFAQVIRSLTDQTIDFNYFMDVEPMNMVEFYAADNDPIYLTNNEYRKALIMPVRG